MIVQHQLALWFIPTADIASLAVEQARSDAQGGRQCPDEGWLVVEIRHIEAFIRGGVEPPPCHGPFGGRTSSDTDVAWLDDPYGDGAAAEIEPLPRTAQVVCHWSPSVSRHSAETAGTRSTRARSAGLASSSRQARANGIGGISGTGTRMTPGSLMWPAEAGTKPIPAPAPTSDMMVCVSGASWTMLGLNPCARNALWITVSTAAPWLLRRLITGSSRSDVRAASDPYGLDQRAAAPTVA